MRVLGVDPGFGRMGVAILEGKPGNESLLYSDCVETSKELSLADRLAVMNEEVRAVIDEWQPEALAIEQLFFSKNQKTALSVAESRGSIISTCREGGLSVFEYGPMEVKVAVTGYGKATKKQVADMVTKLVNLKKIPKHDDEYDAIAVGLTHIAINK